ncbi:GntR family transcriptional regulator [Arcanobacterium haemolyticum]|nr:GntR family transcriptional regulator [Arcanobacterium haemolyticum]
MKPKYTAVYEALVQRIETMNPGDKLASETQLAEDFNVAPMTVRRALEMLANEGRTVGHRGKGTFVAGPPRSRSHADVLSDTSAHLISATLERAGNDVPGLEVDPDAFVYRLVHARSVEGKVVGVQTTTAVASAFEGLLAYKLSQSVSDILNGYNVPATGTVVTATQAGERDAKILEVEVGATCLSVEQCWGESPILAVSSTLVRPDRYALRL